MYMEERDVLKRKMNEYNLEKFGTLVDNGKKTKVNNFKNSL